MKKIKVILLDDEVNAIKGLRFELSKHKEIQIVHEFDNPKHFLEKEPSLDYHGLFLDIDMPKYDMNGIHIAKRINKPIVFVTAHNSKYADDVSEIADMGENYIALIPKTYKKERIENAIKKLHERLNVMQNFVEWNNTTANKRIEIKSIQVISTKDYSLDQLDNSGRNKYLYQDGKKPIHIMNKKLDECLLDLPSEYFFKINDFHVVNKRYIQTVSDKEIVVKISIHDGKHIVVKEEIIKISPNTAEKFRTFYYSPI